MSTTLTVRDESLNGDTVSELTLEFLTERITVRELIRSRVYQEVQDYNRRPPSVFRGLIQPTEEERTLNSSRLEERKPLAWMPQYAKALAAFETGRFLILVGAKQVESLHEEITINPNTQISFLQLTPLAGG
jgi:hypothetical protein